MKKFIFFTILFSVGVLPCFAQKTIAPVKPIKPQQTVVPNSNGAILTEADWQNITAALKAEMWEKSSALAAQALQKIKLENDKKQLAQLRYFYLYSLAGKILALSSANKTAEENLAWQELDKAVSDFTGKEIVLPPRRFLPECRSVLNYICAVKDNERALRVTATNSAGTEIHSFDYILFDEKAAPKLSPDTNIFLGGTLKRAEFNQDLAKPWVMRLFFEKGFVSFAAAAN
jgi:hypothetical protein